MNEAHSASTTTSTNASTGFPRDDHAATPEHAGTTSEAASTKASSGSEDGSEIERRRRERQASLRARRRHRWINALIVVAPVVLTLIYVCFVAVPRYEAESRFFVQSASGQQGGGAAASLLTTGNSGGMLGGFVDGWAVADFVRSRDSMQRLDQKVGLRHYLTNDGWDPLNHLSTDSSEDELYRAYQESVQVSFNALEQIVVLRVSAFSSKDAATLSNALIGLAEEFVSTMNERGVADKLTVSQESVRLAEQKAFAARDALTSWRTAHGNIDPAATVSMLLNLSSKLEGELSDAQIRLDKILALDNKDHFMLKPAKLQVAALKKQIASVRYRLSGDGNTEAKQLKSYEALRNAQAFADSNLTLAQQSYQQAMTDALRLQRYLSIIAQPVPTDQPSSPRTGLLLLQALALGFVLMFLARVAIALLGGLRHG